MIPVKLILKGMKLKRIWKEKGLFYIESTEGNVFIIAKFFSCIAEYIYKEI